MPILQILQIVGTMLLGGLSAVVTCACMEAIVALCTKERREVILSRSFRDNLRRALA